MNLKDKKVLLVGLAKTGISTIKHLNKLGANVVVNDIKDKEKLKDILSELSDLDNVEYILGYHPENVEDLEDNYLALSGVSGLQSIALDEYLKKHHNIKEIALHLDNDDAGRRATNAIMNSYGIVYYVVDQSPARGKDVNEYLKLLTESNSFIPAKQKKTHVKGVR